MLKTITKRDVKALNDLLNRLPKTTAESLWCQWFLQRLEQARTEDCDEKECEDCCPPAD